MYTVQDFKKQYGERGMILRVTLEEFIQRAPAFKGDEFLAKELGKIMADLETALANTK